MKYILILGGTGFIGKNIIENYTIDSTKEDICFIITYRNPKFILKKNLVNIIYIECDVSNSYQLEKIFFEYDISVVFHFLSSSVPVNSNQNIAIEINNNLTATIILLDLMRKYKVNKIIYLSSGGSVYGDDIQNGYQESMTLLPNNAYGITKLTIEKFIHLYNKLYGINYLILRLSNLYGEYHKNEVNGLINIAVRKALKKQIITIWGNGEVRKDYLYIKDFVIIFWKLYNLKNINYIVNVGSGCANSVIEIINIIKSLVPELNYEYTEEKNFDTKNLSFDTSFLKSLIPIFHTPISEGIKATLLWELNSLENTNYNQEHGI